MFEQVGQIMLYVNDQDKAAAFWVEQLQFILISEHNGEDGMRFIELAPSKEAQTRIVLHNKARIAEMAPELQLTTPSLMFFARHLDALHQRLKQQGVTVGDVVDMPTGRVFNFADNEDNYFAVMERV